jgi:hypothetical protein
LNLWRASTNLPTVSENSLYSNGDYLHSQYMVKNDLVTHYETAGTPYYTTDGDTAAKNGNIEVNSTTTFTDEQSIDWWMKAPFHAMGMMDPRLSQVGFGAYREVKTGWQAGFSLDVIRGNSFTGGSYPVFFPGNGTTEPLATYDGNETPDPLSACSGYTAPTGLPVFIEVGGNVATTAGPVHTFMANGTTALEHCVIDSTNPAVGSSLTSRGGVIVVPKQPLQTGVKYTVTLTVNAIPYTWSFTVGPFAVAPPGWQSLGGVLTSAPSATSSTAAADDIFVVGTDRGMWHTSWNGTVVGNWGPGGGIITADPSALALNATNTKVFVRGTDNGLWMATWNGTSYSNWTPLGGILTSGPTSDLRAGVPGSIDVFARGTDNGLWHRWSDNGGSTWSNWEPLGGGLASSPGAVSWATNRVDVVVRGMDNAVWMRSWNASTGWNSWATLGGLATSAPAITSCASGHLDIFVRGSDNGLWQLGFNGTGWTGWKSLGGYWTSAPTAVCKTGTTTIDLYARAVDNAMWTRTVAGS